MNFEFLKNLCGLGYVYENCSNAEKLARTMPMQSMFTARKSAELLAKFIYMAAHEQEMEGLSFADILSDGAVRRFINSRGIMDAFHYIRKSGNRAAHTDEKETPEDAVDVLRDLHYVVGETARMLGLIDDYPQFEDRIEAFPEAVFNDEEDIDKKALEMFIAYVAEHNAWQEREKYISQQDYDWDRYSVEGNVELHECLVFEQKPKNAELTDFLCAYLSTLQRLSVERLPERAEELGLSYPVTLDARIVIGGNAFLSRDAEAFSKAIAEELPGADGFMIDCRCSGVLREYFNEEPDENGNYGELNMKRKDAAWTGSGMLYKLESFTRRERFTYHLLEYLPDCGNVIAAVIENGREKEIRDRFSEDILKYPDLMLDSDGFSIFCEGSKSIGEYPELFDRLKQLVRSNIDETSIRYCEEVWDPNSDEHVEGCILPFVCIKATTVAEIAGFLEKMNLAIEPWQDEVHFMTDDVNLEDSLENTSENILCNVEEFALAVVVCREGKLRLEGTILGSC